MIIERGKSGSSQSPGSETRERLMRSHAPTRAAHTDATQTDTTAAAETKKRARSIDSDEILIDRIREGDRAAFDDLYERYFKRIYAFLDKRLNNRADTEETTQEVFINVFSSLDSFRGEAPFAAWIFGLTRRTLASRFKRKRHPTVPLADQDEERIHSAGGAGNGSTISTEPNPLENYEMAERAASLKRTLEEELTPEQRRVFEMHHLESLSIAEIARTLSKTEDSVKSNLYRTRKLLLNPL